MILTCPSCTTRWTVKPEDLDSPNRMVRCSSCGHTWRPNAREKESEILPDFLTETPQAGSEHPENLEETKDEFDFFLDQDVTRKETAEESPPPERAVDMPPSVTPNAPLLSAYGALPAEMPPLSEANAQKLKDEKKLPNLQPVSLSRPRSRQNSAKAPPAQSVKAARSRSLIGWVFLGFVFFGTAAGIYFGRATIIELWPPAAVAYARAGLSLGFAGEGFDLTDVVAARRDTNGILAIQGRLLNVTNSAKPKPKLKATVYGPGDQLLKEWIFSGPALLPKASGSFQVDLAGLPKTAEKLIVTFTD